MFEVLRDLNRKLDEIMRNQGKGIVPGVDPGSIPHGIPTDGMKRHEVDAMLQNQNVLLNTVLELK